jgi:hypothetical protein
MQIVTTFALRSVVYPAGDIDGVWIAHALDFDLVTQSDRRDQAVEMLEDAVNELVEYRTSVGLPPVELRPAPEEVWELADRVVGSKVPREPASAWVRAGKSNVPLVRTPTAAADASRSEPSPTTYISDRPPGLHAGAL